MDRFFDHNEIKGLGAAVRGMLGIAGLRQVGTVPRIEGVGTAADEYLECGQVRTECANTHPKARSMRPDMFHTIGLLGTNSGRTANIAVVLSVAFPNPEDRTSEYLPTLPESFPKHCRKFAAHRTSCFRP